VDDGISISLRVFDDSIRQAYRALFPDDPDKSVELLDWRFRRNPHGDAKFAVAGKDDQIVGLIALVPTRLRVGSVEMRGYQAIDTVAHPSCRGRGRGLSCGWASSHRRWTRSEVKYFGDSPTPMPPPAGTVGSAGRT